MPPRHRELRRWLGILACCACAALAWITPAEAEVRALIWALDYRNNAADDLALPNTLVDAKSVGEMLRRLQMTDVRVIENPTAETWDAELRSFTERLTSDDVALLYYAGHAVQVGGRNYFLAADGQTLISSDDVLSTVMGKASGTVFLIDACRDNPFRNQESAEKVVRIEGVGTGGAAAGTARSRTLETMPLADLARAGSGLSQMGNLRGKNTIVVFSTDPGNVALDGEPGSGSPFANAVVRELRKRQSLDAAIRRITTDVDERTGGKQSPWRQGDLTFPLFLAGQPRFPVP